MDERIGETVEHFTELRWEFNTEEITAFREADQDGIPRRYERTLDNGNWTFIFSPRETANGQPRFIVRANPQLEDFELASSTESWERRSSYRLEIWLHDPEYRRFDHSLPARFQSNRCFRSSQPTCQFQAVPTMDQYLAAYSAQGKLCLHCKITANRVVQPTPSTSRLLLGLFDVASSADTAFELSGWDGKVSYIFASRAVLMPACSHFRTLLGAESSDATGEMKALNLRTIAAAPRDHLPPLPSIESELVPFFGERGDAEEAYGVSEEARSSNANTADEHAIEVRPRQRRRIGDNIAQVDRDQRWFRVFRIDNTDFRTYRAMLAYLHSGNVPFLPVPSNYLVALARDANFIQDPAKWLQDEFDRVNDGVEWNGIKPCCPRAMYRLSDSYSIDKLRSRSLDFIVRSLTIENAAYELFSPLSLDYKAVQEPILAFVTASWHEVQETLGFEVVFEQFSLGKLARGRELMSTILRRR